MKILIIGFGSIGQRHFKILRNIDKLFKIFVYSRSKNKSINRVYDLNNDTIKKFDYILICNETYLHIKTLNKIYSKNSKTKILIDQTIENFQKIDSDNCRIYIRPSGTEPLIRILIEAKNQKKVNSLSSEITNKLLLEINRILN